MKKIFSVLFIFTLVLVLAACGGNSNPEIKVYTRDTTSGTRDGFFTNIDFKDAVNDNSFLVSSYVEMGGNGEMIRAIKGDQYGLGYISLSSLADSGLKGLNYNGVVPSEENVINETYKLKRNFNYLIRAEYDSSEEEQIVAAYLAYLNTKEGKATIKAKDGIVALEDSDPTWESIKADHPIAAKDNSGIVIKLGGSTSVEKIIRDITAEFSEKCGNFVFEYSFTGSGDAYKKTQGSEKDGTNKLHISFASREFRLEDSEPAAEGTYGKVCTDAIVAVVNIENDLDSITSETLKKIYKGEIVYWNDIK